ncbi:methyltransferase domain-containing protein [Edwardsiella hoshinae]|uniref:Phospholipid N-methyltransferase n=1 Tax=Edwardsiella hoshinae TaxID=93378 RepID=A0A376D9Q8_9GAMM|nr:methyltransferase domain-containing protein [Edwardsiella hoshinae]QPR28103.1 methyltransferase domain-containing protein [Edwardsiella hoshinae]STC84816.1 Phospholipid N-methyltransferase [Edwardsiella hoshinae]
MLFSESLKTTAGFITQFVRSPRTVGAISPSTPFLCREMVRAVDWRHTQSIAEFGAGTGVLTRHIQHCMRNDARLTIFETNPHFCQALRQIVDWRAQIYNTSASEISQRYDVIFSGLPLLAFSAEQRHAILGTSAHALKPGGLFIQFQYSSLLENHLTRHFHWQRSRVWRNLPPAFVYRCRPR